MTTPSTTSTPSPTVAVNWSKIVPSANSEVAKICLKNLRNFLTGQYSPAEFETEQNYVLASVVDELRYEKLPVEPESSREYNVKKGNDRFDTSAFLKDHPEITEYYNRLSEVNWRNVFNAQDVERLLVFFNNNGDKQQAARVRVVYQGYPLTLYVGGHQQWKRKSNL